MVFPLNYRRPAQVRVNKIGSEDGVQLEMRESSTSDSRSSWGSNKGIPDELAFDRIMDNKTCPPCTVRDMMNYLLYVEYSAENLQFFLWYRSYVKRFQETKLSDPTLIAEWTQSQQDAAMRNSRPRGPIAKAAPVQDAVISKDGDDDKKVNVTVTDLESTPTTPSEDSVQGKSEFNEPQPQPKSTGIQHQFERDSQMIGEDYLVIQSFREEVSRAVATYVTKDVAPRELNISDRDRNVLLQALQYTIHPTAFKAVAASIEATLRRQSHPNFVRWAICNGNRPRVVFARGLGAFLILAGFLVAILLTLSKRSQGWRAFAALSWLLGVSTAICAYKGMCVVLHGLHHRHIRPWELFEEGDDVSSKASFDTLPRTIASSSYEKQPWVEKYARRNVIRKIFDREMWIEEPALRQIQDTIFLQSILAGSAFAVIFTIIFIVIPTGDLF